ncbi:ABC transporter permease [Pseudothermotoga hypogea DSM 11164 = NBRC 106472]|uniref:ABC transporter permease n=1 Tax=Pseudothermotoga hypogea DSM 11164 = NBRC 106472 TaxID=1123384 RepID=A0A0X1KRJ3_9THEM|nr:MULTISPECIES: sugar ABC transporter permease [Pseudothermotoga]AJC73810.1 ABC transporter permease [Pseudothermotoga hypogea DSM 11164 = NBRC 106472]MDI6862028.1 sugar ABC transporter permease [Pseudothermotoga sp.]
MRRESFVPFLLILPTLVYLMVFIGYPIVGTFQLSFTSDEGWLGNFKYVFSSKDFQNAFLNTLILGAVVIPIQFVLAILFALLVNKKWRGYRTLLYIIAAPLALSDVTAALISYSIFAPNGYLNKILLSLNWIERPLYFFGYMFKSREFLVIVLTEIWRATPLVFVILLAGLQSINTEYLEAADVFGFSSWKKFFKITLPLLKPSIVSALLIRTLFAFQIFGVVWLLAGRDITVLAGETYYWYVLRNNRYIASTYALVIAVLTFIVGWFYIGTIRSKHLEEGVRQ